MNVSQPRNGNSKCPPVITFLLFLTLATGARAITISEIMYNTGGRDPGDEGSCEPREGDRYVEFVEIYNEDGEARDLSHYFFSRGITFQFSGFEEGASTYIRGKSYIVVAKDVQMMLELYPHLNNSDPLFPQVVGPFEGCLDNSGETIALANPGGAIDSQVSYNNRGGWPAAADGTGHSLILKDPDLDDPEDNDNWTWSSLLGGSPGLSNTGELVYPEVNLIEEEHSWNFFRGTQEPSDPVEAWRQPDFDDSQWEVGMSPIGFGDECYNGTILDDMQNNYSSVFFRTTFQIDDPADAEILKLEIYFDDGFVAYLNGTEVARRNLRSGSEAFSDLAYSSSECSLKREYTIATPGDLLVPGENVLAVQVHNRLLTDADFGMFLRLYMQKGVLLGFAPKIDVDLNELLWNTDGEAWLEIYNDSDSGQDVDLSEYFLSDDPGNLLKYQFPAGTVIPHGNFLVLSQGDVSSGDADRNVELRNSQEKTHFLALSRILPDQPPETSIQVVDAYRFRMDHPEATGYVAPREMSDARYPDGKDNWVFSRTPTRGEANQFVVNGDVVINEIMYAPFYPLEKDFVSGDSKDNYGLPLDKSEDQGEYIELFNRGAEKVPLAGWAFTKGVEYVFPPDLEIGPGEYLVVARDPQYIMDHYGLSGDKVKGPWYNLRYDANDQPILDSAVLSDAGEKIELVDEIGNPVDGVHYYDNGRWSIWADGRGSSLERIDPHQAGDRAGNWDSSDESSKSQWHHYTWEGRYSGNERELLIVLLSRGIVHIDNLTVVDAATPGANLIDNGDFENPFNTAWNLDGTHIHSGRINTDKVGGEYCLKIISTGRGNNRIDRIRVANPPFSNRLYRVELDARWICGEANLMICGQWNTFAHQFNGADLDPPDPDVPGLLVPRKLGSPGAENSVTKRLQDGNLGPLVGDIGQDPVLPAANQDVILTARVTDSDGVDTVTLRHSLDGIGAAKAELPMKDDGQDADEVAGDGIYTAVVPGAPLGRRKVFEILATDTRGNTGRFPFDDRKRTHPYLLDPPGAGDNEISYAVYIHSNLVGLGDIPDYRIVLAQENLQYLNSRHIMNNDMVDSTLVWNDREIWYNVQVRYANSPWTRSSNPKSFRLKLPRKKQLQGLMKFKLDNRRNVSGAINERAAYYMIRSSNIPGRDGVPWQRSTYTRPFLNANTYASWYFERVEVPGKQWIRRWFPNDENGTLYKLDDLFLVNLPHGTQRSNRDAYIQYRGEDEESYRWYFLQRTREKYDDFSELISLAKFFSQNSGQNYNEGIWGQINVEEVIRTLAVEINTDDWDTWGTTRGKNCYIYRPRIDGRWHLIGWDKDLTWGSATSLPLVPSKFGEVSKLLSSGSGRRVYYSVMSDMLERYFKPEYINQFFNQHRIDRYGQAIPGVPTAGAQANFASVRGSTMRNVLPRVEPEFSLITGSPSGNLSVEDPILSVDGNAPMRLWQILVTNHVPPRLDPMDPDVNKQWEKVLDVNSGDLNWLNTTRWRTLEPLPDLVEGEVNLLTFSGFTADGEFIGSDQILVACKVQWDPPQILSVEPNRGISEGGTTVVISGISFHIKPDVFFGPRKAEVIGTDETAGTITVLTPEGTPGPADVKVENIDGQSDMLAGGFTYAVLFNRGDVDFNGTLDLTDAIVNLDFQFKGLSIPCVDAADVDDDGAITLTDPIYLLDYLFRTGEPPPPPFDPTGNEMGEDPTDDPLGCG